MALVRHGAWYNQGVGDEQIFISMFEEGLFDTHIQSWRYEIEDMTKLRTYKLLKENLICEDYLNEIDIASYRKILTKLRGSLLRDLRANTGRYEYIPFEDRICSLCTSSIEDGCHFLLQCNVYSSVRKDFIPQYYYVHPTYEKFKMLLSRRSNNVLINICNRKCYNKNQGINAVRYR